MTCTALVYLLHTLRMYVPETNSRKKSDCTLAEIDNDCSGFWIQLAHRPITRVYSSDLRPSMAIENLLFRLAENWQVGQIIDNSVIAIGLCRHSGYSTFSRIFQVICIVNRTSSNLRFVFFWSMHWYFKLSVNHLSLPRSISLLHFSLQINNCSSPCRSPVPVSMLVFLFSSSPVDRSLWNSILVPFNPSNPLI